MQSQIRRGYQGLQSQGTAKGICSWAHIISSKHDKEFFALLNESEALGAKAAVSHVAEMMSELEQHATREHLAADGLRGAVCRVVRVRERRACDGVRERRAQRAEAKIGMVSER